MPVEELLISHHSHTDIGYTHEQPVLWELQARYIDAALAEIDKTADWPPEAQFKWTCEVSAPVLYWLRRAPSRQVERFVAAVRAGRMEVMALFCNLTPLMDLEELYRSLLPVARLRRELGIPIRAAMTSDVNGLPWSIVDVLLDSGITGLTMAINEHMGGAPLRRPNLFHWVGPSGRRLLAYNGFQYGFLQQFGVGEKDGKDMRELEEVASRLTKWLREIEAYCPLPVIYTQNTRLDHWDNNGPQEKLAPFVRAWNEAGLRPRLRVVTPSEALDRLRQLPDELCLQVRGDWTDYWTFGAGSSIEPMRINRRSRTFLLQADALAVLSGRDPQDRPLADEAWWNLFLFDEHTWGAWCSISDPDSEFTRAQWGFKEDLANRAASLSGFLRRQAIAGLASKVDYRGSTPAVLVYNPLPRPVRRRVTIPADWNNPQLPATLAHQHRWDSYWRMRGKFTVTEPVELPALGWKVVPIPPANPQPQAGEGPEAVEAAGVAQASPPGLQWDEASQTLRTPWYELCLHPDRQGIVSWRELATGRELVDQTAPYAFGQAILERCTSLDGRQAFWHSGRWYADWPAVRIPATPGGPWQGSPEPGALRLQQQVNIPELPPLTFSLRFFADNPAVELEINGRLPDHTRPEGLYLVFPLNRGQSNQTWRAWFTTAGQVVELDREQIPGACRDYVTVDTWAYIEPCPDASPRVGLQIVCPDNPLLMLGAFNFGKRLERIPENAPAWVLAWVANNYWQTNFRAAQPGPFRQRYWLVPHAVTSSPAASASPGHRSSPDYSDVANGRVFPIDDTLTAALWRTADELLAEPVLHPIPRPQAGVLPATGQAFSCDFQKMRLLTLKPAETGTGIVLRVHNPTGRQQSGQIVSARLTIAAAWLCDGGENPTEELQLTQLTGDAKSGVQASTAVAVELPPYTTRTVLLSIAG